MQNPTSTGLAKLTHIPVKNEVFKKYFKPVNVQAFEGLLYEHTIIKNAILKFYDDFNSEHNKIALLYLIKSHRTRFNRSVDFKPDVDVATKQLDSQYWKKAFDEIDLYEMLPAEDKKKWDELIEKNECPPFDEKHLVPTIRSLLEERETFLIRRVAGIFRALSPNHVTNSKSKFEKRFIIAATDKYEYLHDFRKIAAELDGEVFKANLCDTKNLIEVARSYHRGEWRYADLCKVKLRAYLKGTVHVEMSPKLALVMNEILSLEYGYTLSSDIREAVKKNQLNWKPLPKQYVSIPYNVCGSIREIILDKVYRTQGSYEICYLWGDTYKENRQIFDLVLTAAGGFRELSGTRFRFQNDPRPLLDEMTTCGFIPDQVASQFFPTPIEVAKRVYEIAHPQKGESLLEPNVGTACLLRPFLHQGLKITVIDREPLYANYVGDFIGVTAYEGDFIKLSEELGKYSLVVMNPPFKNKQAIAHVQAAINCLEEGGRAVAIVPDSAIEHLESVVYREPIDESLFGVSIKMSIIKIIK